MMTLIGLASLLLAASPPSEKAAPAPADSSDKGDRIEIELPQAPWTGDLDGMLERRRLRVLVPYSHTEYSVDLGKPSGVLYEAFTELERQLNKETKKTRGKHLDMHVRFVPARREDFMDLLVAGIADVAAGGLTITDERQAKVDFSAPVLTGVKEVVITGPQSPVINTMEDLAGQEVFVRRSSSYYEHLVALNAARQKEGKAPIKIGEVSEALNDEDLLQMVDVGLLGIVIVDDYRAHQWEKALKNIKIHEDVAIHTDGQIAVMMRKDSPLLKARIDKFLKTSGRGTRFGEILFKKYFAKPPVLRSATRPSELKKFDKTVALFQKYGEKYDIDHILMMAQGYQESRLNQQAKSPVGAIGVMQIMPQTGKELRVGDIEQVGPNINGGVKYIRQIIDHNYADTDIDRINQVLFAFAAYNCGPGRVNSLRREAEKRGLNPNVWFNNVEQVAAARIGAETVTYVANILKYYTAYKAREDLRVAAAAPGTTPTPATAKQ